MTDTKLLRIRIDESGYKMHFIAQKLGLTYQGFLNKLNNKHEFKATEIRMLQKLLNLSNEERDRIFFTLNVEL